MNGMMGRYSGLIRFRVILIAALLASLALSLGSVGVSRAAATIVVNSTSDTIANDGACSLREAITAANNDSASGTLAGECAAGSGTDTIVLPAGTYTLSRSGWDDYCSIGDLDVKQSVTISGAGATTTIINTSSTFKDRIFHIISGSVTISGVTIQGGKPSGDGGGIYNSSTLTLIDSAVVGNTATSKGGGIYNASSKTLTITGSTLSGNAASYYGGGLYNAGTATLTNVTLSGNKANTTTGGYAPGSSSNTLSGSTTYGGGGLYNSSGTATLTNVTFSANAGATTTGSGGSIRRTSGTVKLKNTILANPTSGGNCNGTVTSNGYNLSSDSTCASSLNNTGDLNNVNPLLGPLQNNGGGTSTHALLAGSPAIEAGTTAGCPATDQRGVSRPRGVTCDIGAYESENPAQAGPIFTVNAADDTDDGVCSYTHCSLREAIHAANARPNGATPDQIVFSLLGSAPFTLQPGSPLPTITGAVIIDGSTQPGGALTIDGSNAGATANGLTFASGGSTLTGVTISHFGGAAISITGGAGTLIIGNSLFDNNGLGIDLGGDGVTPNDAGDGDSGPNGLQNYPVLLRAVPDADSTKIDARLNSTPNTAFTVRFYSNAACHPSGYGEGRTFIGSANVTTDATGDVYFSADLATVLADGQFVTATATGPDSGTSEFSQCVRAGLANDSWVGALRLTLTGDALSQSAAFDQLIDANGQSRWFKFKVQPGSQIVVELTGLPANYDLTVYKDIAAAFDDLTSPQDLVRLDAEFAPDAYSPDAYSPDAYSPDAYSPDAYSPDAYSPDAYSPDAYSPDAYSPDAYSPDAYSPDAYSPDAYSPDAYSPDAYSPDAYSPDAYSPDAFSPDAYSSAQTRSLIGVSAFDGTAGEGLVINTWDNGGDFYVRVRGRNGVFSLDAPFHLSVTQLAGSCGSITTILPASDTTALAGNYKTIILTDLARMEGSTADRNSLQAALATFAARLEVTGAIVDVSADDAVAFANAQADANPACPFAKNVVAYSIKDIVDAYRALNPLEYVVIVGGDEVIPFFRHADQAQLGNEKNFVPPVRDATPSQASLKLGYLLSQDRYGAAFDVSSKTNDLPIVDLAVGRLVETAADATAMLNAYLGTIGGVVQTPASSLVTGYDFLEDAALAVQAELEAGVGASADTLILDRGISPADPLAWTADDLRGALLSSRHDLIFLAGHFSASSALAADYSTRLQADEIASSPVDFTNSIVFSVGCHAGYNIVNAHGVPLVTREPDWAQAFAQKGATLIAGTGYQYGDTDFIEYSERLYLTFARQLRTGSGPVPVGKALVAAKQEYLALTADVRAIHEKAYLEATLFGLPMLSVNMPGARFTPPPDASIVVSTQTFTSDPGETLGLAYADVALTPTLTLNTKLLNSVGLTETVTATYLSGSDGVVSNPTQPVLPLETHNASVANFVLRGLGFLGGDYVDLTDVLPLTGAAATEVRGVHSPFPSTIFYPVDPWSINQFAALAEGSTNAGLVVMPAQFKADSPDALTGTLRQFTRMNFRLYYSNNTSTFANGSTPALSGPPDIVQVSSAVNGSNVEFSINVVGNPAAGVQEVWVTYTALSGPYAGQWQSLHLAQSAGDSTLWTGALPLSGTPSGDVRFIVQAANGVGLVNLATNIGAYYTPGGDVEPTNPTAIAIEVPPASGAYGTLATFSAVLTSSGSPLANQTLTFALGPQRRAVTTDGDGRATASLVLLGLPGFDELRVSFAGNTNYIASTATSPFTVNKQATTLTLSPSSATSLLGSGALMTATLTDASGRSLGEKAIFFVLTGSEGSLSVSEITDYAGRATLRDVALPPGVYNVAAAFSGAITLDTLEVITLDDERYLPSSASGTLTLEDVPDTTITVTPPNPSSSSSATFEFSGSDAITPPGSLAFECRLDGGSFAACISPITYSGLSDGSHTFEVRARDTAGNVDATPASFTWTIDATAPDTSLTGTPANPSNGSSATFTFTGSDGGTGVAGFECRLDSGGFAPCAGPVAYSGLADGAHTFDVRAMDALGTVDASPASFTWTIDTLAPDTTITLAPPDPSTSTTATFEFTGSDGGTGVAAFECRLDGGGFAPCASPTIYTGLGGGAHTFEVRAKDTAGNVDATPATFTWTVNAAFCPGGVPLDNFNRADGALGANWSGATSTLSYKIAGNRVDVELGGAMYWRNPSFGVDQQAFLTLSKIGPLGLHKILLKVQGTSSASWTKGMIGVFYNDLTYTAGIDTYVPGAGWSYPGLFPATFAAGDVLGARARADGTVEVYKNCTLIGQANAGSFFANKGGRIGVWFIAALAEFDDFGGGTVTP